MLPASVLTWIKVNTCHPVQICASGPLPEETTMRRLSQMAEPTDNPTHNDAAATITDRSIRRAVSL